MKKTFLIGILLFGLALSACGSGNNASYKFKNQYKIFVDDDNSEVISGAISFDNWFAEANWLSVNENSGHIDSLIAKSAGSIINSGDYFLLVFTGSWCTECRTQLPIIKRVIDVGKFDEKKVQLLGVDKNNTVWKHEKLDIRTDKYPTVVVMYQSKEIGRIVGFPQNSWEYDILQVLYRGDSYSSL